MGFCSMDCRYGYFHGEVVKRQKKLAAVLLGQRKMSSVVTRMAAGKANKAAAGKKAGEVSCRPIFFTCAEAE